MEPSAGEPRLEAHTEFFPNAIVSGNVEFLGCGFSDPQSKELLQQHFALFPVKKVAAPGKLARQGTSSGSIRLPGGYQSGSRVSLGGAGHDGSGIVHLACSDENIMFRAIQTVEARFTPPPPPVHIPTFTVYAITLANPDWLDVATKASTLAYPATDTPKRLTRILEGSQVPGDFRGTDVFFIHTLNLTDADNQKQPAVNYLAFRAPSPDEAFQWVQDLQDIVEVGERRDPSKRPGVDKSRRALLLLNPFGGRKKASKIYETYVRPMMSLAGYYLDVRSTEYPRHASEIIQSLPDITNYSRLLTVSGDGLFHEMINGLLNRPDRDTPYTVIGHDGYEAEITPREVPVGIVPAGTGNALSKNIDAVPLEWAVLSVIRGRTNPLDVISVTQKLRSGDKRVFSHLGLYLGLVADIDIESERYRNLGQLRSTMSALTHIMSPRVYRIKLYTYHGTTRATRPSGGDPLAPKFGDVTIEQLESGTAQGWSKEPVDEITYFMALNQPWVDTNTYCAPAARLSDGLITINYTGQRSAKALLTAFLDAENGGMVTKPWMAEERVVAYALVPEGAEGQGEENIDEYKKDLIRGRVKGALDVDGELAPFAPVIAESFPAVLNLIVAPWFREGVWGAKVAPWRKGRKGNPNSDGPAVAGMVRRASTARRASTVARKQSRKAGGALAAARAAAEAVEGRKKGGRKEDSESNGGAR
ncbi:hypothetical protein M427DRAFT_152809 [Gonapodya prolifera JEL478]|uniref:DAGKc domain-containing protein n=1 Tax=Gonapodya prolifera (strain JEL478) TaxID=1344416 RepID=A0A139APX8_GONPJ|nr:hypothetical protein M427DRAFT_152809 [Gonapodya prolifera JEL478]|eukprot:KXS18807.1 hypothetical protein M427DRAFT_152809 [Gonapodya prolifera JEL478]